MSTHPHLALALELTQLPTAAGREDRVITFIERWCQSRPELVLTRDQAGNMIIAFPGAQSSQPLFITGHLDHPAFVVERVINDTAVELSFRGGVMDVFFEAAPITLFAASATLEGTLTGQANPSKPAGQHYTAAFPSTQGIRVGDIARWTMPPAHIDAQGLFHTHACDDLVAVAAALCAFDELRAKRAQGESIPDVRLLFTRAEEIGFIGAIAACKLGTMPAGSRVIALENSRAFPDSPIGGGPIVRVGDRISIFNTTLTAACAARAEELFGNPANPAASQTTANTIKRPWQRKLMAGGACEASVFCHHGYEATCICLPLGNYHNMPHLDALQAGTYNRDTLGPPRCAPEFIHTNDYLALIELLVALGQKIPANPGLGDRFNKLYNDRHYVLHRGSHNLNA